MEDCNQIPKVEELSLVKMHPGSLPNLACTRYHGHSKLEDMDVLIVELADGQKVPLVVKSARDKSVICFVQQQNYHVRKKKIMLEKVLRSLCDKRIDIIRNNSYSEQLLKKGPVPNQKRKLQAKGKNQGSKAFGPIPNRKGNHKRKEKIQGSKAFCLKESATRVTALATTGVTRKAVAAFVDVATPSLCGGAVKKGVEVACDVGVRIGGKIAVDAVNKNITEEATDVDSDTDEGVDQKDAPPNKGREMVRDAINKVTNKAVRKCEQKIAQKIVTKADNVIIAPGKEAVERRIATTKRSVVTVGRKVAKHIDPCAKKVAKCSIVAGGRRVAKSTVIPVVSRAKVVQKAVVAGAQKAAKVGGKIFAKGVVPNAAKPIARKIFTAAGGLPAMVLSEAVSLGYSAYKARNMESCEFRRHMCREVVQSVGSLAGGVIGTAIGTAILPGLGTFFGGFIGSMAGRWIASKWR